jgi:hypothetical protein
MDRDALRPEVGVLRSERRKVLLATCPVGRTPSLMGYRNDPNFIAQTRTEDQNMNRRVRLADGLGRY